MEGKMHTGRLAAFAALLLAIGLLLGGCITDSGHELQVSPLSQVSPLTVATLTPTPASTPTPAPIQLVVLHTNDNWGETEPCG